MIHQVTSDASTFQYLMRYVDSGRTHLFFAETNDMNEETRIANRFRLATHSNKIYNPGFTMTRLLPKRDSHDKIQAYDDTRGAHERERGR